MIFLSEQQWQHKCLQICLRQYTKKCIRYTRIYVRKKSSSKRRANWLWVICRLRGKTCALSNVETKFWLITAGTIKWKREGECNTHVPSWIACCFPEDEEFIGAQDLSFLSILVCVIVVKDKRWGKMMIYVVRSDVEIRRLISVEGKSDLQLSKRIARWVIDLLIFVCCWISISLFNYQY